MSVLFKQQPLAGRGLTALALSVSAAVGAGLLLSLGPLADLIFGGAACAAATSLFLLQRPLSALYVALFIRLMPWPYPPTEFPDVIIYAQNGAIALAFCAWMPHALSQRPPITWNGVYFLIALYMVWASVTLLWAHDIVVGLEKLRRYSAGVILLFLIVNLVKSPRAIDGVMRVLAMIGWFIVIFGLWTALFSDYHTGERLHIEGINENMVGQYLILMLAGAIWPIVRSSGLRRSFHLALSIVYILCTLILVLLSGSRGSTFALAIGLVALCFWKPLRPWGIVGGALVACLFAAMPFLLDTVSNRITQSEGGEFGGRDILWKASFNFIVDHPLTGAGVANGRFELRPYIGALTTSYGHRNDLPPHNPLLEVGIDTGLFGMLVYLGVIVTALHQFFRNRTRLYMRGGALAAYFPIVLASAAGYLVGFSKDGSDYDPLFFMVLALLIIPSQLSHASRLADTAARRVVAPPQLAADEAPRVARTNN